MQIWSTFTKMRTIPNRRAVRADYFCLIYFYLSERCVGGPFFIQILKVVPRKGSKCNLLGFLNPKMELFDCKEKKFYLNYFLHFLGDLVLLLKRSIMKIWKESFFTFSKIILELHSVPGTSLKKSIKTKSVPGTKYGVFI